MSFGITILFEKPPEQPKERYRWINVVVADPYGIKDHAGNEMVVPYVDPPPGGYGYNYADQSSYYWDDVDFAGGRLSYRVDYNWEGDTFRFRDVPNDTQLKPGESVDFRTCLVDTYMRDREIKCVNWKLMNGKIYPR